MEETNAFENERTQWGQALCQKVPARGSKMGSNVPIVPSALWKCGTYSGQFGTEFEGACNYAVRRGNFMLDCPGNTKGAPQGLTGRDASDTRSFLSSIVLRPVERPLT